MMKHAFLQTRHRLLLLVRAVAVSLYEDQLTEQQILMPIHELFSLDCAQRQADGRLSDQGSQTNGLERCFPRVVKGVGAWLRSA